MKNVYPRWRGELAHGQRQSALPDGRQPPILHILAPEWQEHAEEGWLGQELKGTGFVYADHACLWRTQALLRQYGEIRMPDNARDLVDGVYEQKIAAPTDLKTFSDIAFGKVLSQRSVAAQNLLRHDLGYDRESSDFLWDKDREFSTRLGEESVDVYLARKGIDGQVRPLVDEIDFCWEKSRLSVRKSWWQKNSGTFQCPDEETLTCFRKRHHRPSGHIVLVSEMGEASYYSKRFGLV